MKRNFLRLVCAMSMMASMIMPSYSQTLPPLPVDSAVRINKLPNGLTYYIRHNDLPKGQADFYIAQNVGSILEEDNQRGLAHFLEHMCFNGTENFPGNSMIDWLESIGVKFGYNLNAYTGVDQTVYNISNVPVTRTGVQDTTLMILHDWADGLLLDPTEIDKERGVIHEEWRTTNRGEMRILQNLLPTMYPGSKYGYRLPIGTMEIIDNFPPIDLRNYYEKWYRPDLQGVIVVGDVDVDYIENKIKELFSPIKTNDNPAERVYEPVPDTEGIIYAIGSDPETSRAIAQLMFKSNPIPHELKATAQYPMMAYMLNMMQTMLEQRHTELSQDPNAKFAQAGLSYGPFFLAKTKDALTLGVIAKDNDIIPGFEQAYRELLRAQRGGFTVSEYDRARQEYLSQLETKYNGRNRVQNDSYVQQYVDNFTDGEPLMSIEQEYELMNQIAPVITVDMINSLLPQMITKDNRILLGLFPENETFRIPTQEDFEKTMASVEAEEIEPYRDTMKEEPLIPSLPVPGQIVSVSHDDQWDAELMTLSNGINIYVKHTENKPDQIVFDAIAIGGSSTIPDENADDILFMPVAMSRNGLGDYTSTDLEKYLQGKQVSLDYSIDTYNRELSGVSTVKDLPTLMELIYMTFIDYTITEDDFAATQSMLANLMSNQSATPEFNFKKTMLEDLYKSPAKHAITPEIIKKANREKILEIARQSLSNAADFVFIFTGDVTVDLLKPLAEQYLATLPSITEKTTEYTQNPAREFTPGKSTQLHKMAMAEPKTFCSIVVSGYMPYNAKNKTIASIASQILTNRLLKKIREEMQAVYSISAYGGMTRQGSVNTFFQIPFPMKPEMKDQVIKEIESMIKGMCKKISADELNPIKEFMLKQVAESHEDNGAIASSMAATQLNGVDNYNGAEEVINSITVKDVEKFMKALLKQKNYRISILEAE